MVRRCKDIKLSGTLQNEQVGVLIIKLKGSTSAKLRNHDLVTTPTQDSLNGFSELIHWCVGVASAFSVLISIILPVTVYSRNLLIRNHRLLFL